MLNLSDCVSVDLDYNVSSHYINFVCSILEYKRKVYYVLFSYCYITVININF